MGSHKNYPAKIRELIDEAREIREKNKQMEERLRYYEETKKKTYAEMLVLEDRSRDLKTKIGAYSGNQDDQ